MIAIKIIILTALLMALAVTVFLVLCPFWLLEIALNKLKRKS